MDYSSHMLTWLFLRIYVTAKYWRGCSKAHPQCTCVFWIKSKKIVYPCILQFYFIKVGVKGIGITRTGFPDT